MRLLDFVIIRLTICLILGIIFAHFNSVSFNSSIYIVLYAVILLGIALLILKKSFNYSSFFGLLTYISVFAIGILSYNLSNQTIYSKHYTNNSIDIYKPNNLCLKISKKLKSTLYHHKYEAKILTINNKTFIGNILLNIDKDSLNRKLSVDDILYLNTHLNEVKPPLNPGQFNYKAYLKKRGIIHQIYANHEDLISIDLKDKTLIGIAANFRDKINKELRKKDFKPEELAIINALLLGQRDDISRETYNNYAGAGAIHILAVSGLHIGIILLILQLLMRPLNYFKNGNYYRIIIILLIIWVFAIIAGLSASVTRAVTMFTAVTIAINLKRANNIYNTLAISAFVLLLIKPNFLFEVGFQLSYLAVLSIVAFQPMFYKWINFETKILRYFWGLFTVTLAAQIGVAPLSLFYFHQFPGLFFISNLIILPFLGIILGMGILVILLSLIGILPSIVVKFYGFFISGMNIIVEWISKQEAFLFKDITFNIYHLISSYVLIISVLILLKLGVGKGLKYALIGIIAIQLSYIATTIEIEKSELIIFNRSRVSVIGERYDSTLNIYSELDSNSLKELSFIRDYKIMENIQHIHSNKLKNMIEFNGDKILIIDSLGAYNVKTFKPDIVLLRNSPRLNINRMIDSISPILIIADGSNYRSYLSRWRETCIDKKIPFHATAEKGAFIFKD